MGEQTHPCAGRPVDTPPTLRLTTLGAPRIVRGDTALPFKRKKALALLVYLARTGGVHTRDALAALLVDEAGDAQARGQFRNTLHDLTTQVGDQLLVTRQTVAFDRGRPYWLDAEQLEGTVRAADDPASDTAALERAVSLYQGEFLAGLALTHVPAFDAWRAREQERLHELLLQALQRLLARALRADDAQAAQRWAARLLEAEPWHEETHRQLMRLLARRGQRQAALAQYEACRRILQEELGIEPEPETVALYERLRASPLAPPGNLPAPPAGFVGREAELALVAERLADPACRLLTLLGLGGSGKSSLALRAAVDRVRPVPLLDEHPFADGVYLVELAAVSAPRPESADRGAIAMQRLAMTIGRAVGLEFRGADPAAHLVAWLRERALLLVLDNMEHLLDGVALLTLLLKRAARLKVLATSRERLRLPEEWVLEVGGLPVPAGPDDIERAAASTLYLQLMRQAGASALPDAAERAAIARICALTQGLPLALALAARWTPSLPTVAIARELATGLDLLTATGGHPVPERQRSMRAVLQATWARLNEEEQGAMRRLAVFQPGFTREAARAVAGVELPTLLMLGEGALLGCDPALERYAMHEFVRQFAAEQLRDHPNEEAAMRARHAAFYAGLVERVTQALLQTDAAQAEIGADIANIQVAWDWAADRANAGILERMLKGFTVWFDLQGLPGQVIEMLDRAAGHLRVALMQAATPDPSMQRLLGFILVQEASDLNWLASYDRARVLLEEADRLARATASPHLEGWVANGIGFQLSRQHDLAGAARRLRRALALACVAQEPDLEADALQTLGYGAARGGEYPQARGYLERALALFRSQNNRRGEARVLYFLGMIARAQGDFGVAQRLLEDALRLASAMGWQRLGNYFVLHELGLVHDEGRGRHMAAEEFFAQGLRSTQETGDRAREAVALAVLGRNALYQGDIERARRFLDQALRLSREVGSQEGATMALRGHSLLAHYGGDDQRARRCAEEAMDIARTTGLRRDERLAVRLLGHALLALGELRAALVAYQQVAELDELLGFAHLRVETMTDLARVALARGDLAQATARVAAILPDLEHTALGGLEEPTLAFLTCYRVLREAGDDRADVVLGVGYTFLQARAAQFVEAQRRARFLRALPAHRDLLAAWQAGDEQTVSAGDPPAPLTTRRVRLAPADIRAYAWCGRNRAEVVRVSNPGAGV